MAPLEQAARVADVSYRQAHYWASKGWLKVTWTTVDGVPVDHGGSGYRAWVSAVETEHLKRMGQLVRAGISPERALSLARLLRRQHSVQLGEGLVLTTRAPRPKIRPSRVRSC